MAVTSIANGTQSCTVTTEHTLATKTNNGVYVFMCDLSNAVNGDSFTIKIYTKDIAGGTSRLAYVATYAHAQTELHKYSIPVPSDIEYKVSITQDTGTSRNVDWSLLMM